MSDRPSETIVNCDPSTFILGPDGEPLNAVEIREWTDDEIAASDAHLTDREAELKAARPPLEHLADHLETLPGDRVVTASDLLAFLRPEESKPDA